LVVSGLALYLAGGNEEGVAPVLDNATPLTAKHEGWEGLEREEQPREPNDFIYLVVVCS